MVQNRPHGVFYTTDDLIRMAKLEVYGQHSSIIEQVLIKFKILEQENKQLKEIIKQLQSTNSQIVGTTIDKLM